MASPREKLNRASFTLMETIKDYVLTSFVTVAQSSKNKLTAAQIQELQTLISQSIEAGYHRGAVGFIKEVDSVISQYEK